MTPSASFRDLTLAQFVDRLASAEPVPGGGSAAAIAGSIGAGLVSMVAALSEGRPIYAQHAVLHGRAGSEARALSERFLALADEDADAYAAFGAALKLPRETDDQKAARTLAMRAAARVASDVPLRTVEACLELIELAESLAGRCNRNASSDLDVSALLVHAASHAAAANVYVNLPSIGDEGVATELRDQTRTMVERIEQLASLVHDTVRDGEERPPIDMARE